MKKKMKILVALKFVEDPERIIEKSKIISITSDASIYLIHVLQDMPRMSFYSDAYKIWEEFRDTAVRETLKKMNNYIKKMSVEYPDIEPIVDVGDPAEIIVNTAEKLKVDLIIVGNQPKRKGISSLVHQHTGEKIVRLTKKPILSVYLGR